MFAPDSLFREFAGLRLPTYPSVTGLSQPIAFRSLAEFILACGWAWLLLVSFTGWGRLTAGLTRARAIPASVACALGIAALVFIGGLLNLAHALYGGVLIALAIAGVILYALLLRDRPAEYRWRAFWRQASPWTKILFVAALILVAVRAAATVRLGLFNNFDDGAAYLVFAHKLLATHHFAFDPFSDRRIISSLGGAYLLQAFVIAATSLSHIAMADRTLGLVLLAAALFDIGIAFELSPWQIALLEFISFLVPQPTINLTFIVLPTSLLLAMIWLILKTPEENPGRIRHAILAGAVGGAIISLKSTFLPCVGAFALIPYILLSSRKRRVNVWQLPILAGIGAAIALAAWMIAMKVTSGSYLFPILGHGVDYSSRRLFQNVPRFASTRSVLKVFLQPVALLILAAIQMASGFADRRIRFSVGILIAAGLAILAFNYATGADFIWRYNFPQFFAAIVIFYAATAAMSRNVAARRQVRIAYGFGIACLVLMVFYYDAAGTTAQPFRTVRLDAQDYRIGLHASLAGTPLANAALVREYRTVEAALPAGAVAVENTAYPFLFDYGNRHIFLADWPGAASPKPGWPFTSNPEDLGKYLRGNGIRYVIYDREYADWVDASACKGLEKVVPFSQELLALWRITLVAHYDLHALQFPYQSIYDDGRISVIDLDAPELYTMIGKPWTLQTNPDEMCSAVLAQYLAAPLRSK